MTGGVGEVEGAVEDIAVAVIGLGIGGVGDDGVGAGKSAQAGHVKSGPVIQ
ncbi:MAG: hypothetical protein BroJett015_43700 [Chloroflexota bacterium]|nr:MAG: hypothetical protein BroJett015_43700 [Chloroflexota bacterium]